MKKILPKISAALTSGALAASFGNVLDVEERVGSCRLRSAYYPTKLYYGLAGDRPRFATDILGDQNAFEVVYRTGGQHLTEDVAVAGVSFHCRLKFRGCREILGEIVIVVDTIGIENHAALAEWQSFLLRDLL